MLQLNKSNGDIAIGDVLITSSFCIANVDLLQNRYNVRFNLSNEGYSSYSVTNADDNAYAFTLLFYKDNLQWVTIALGAKHSFEPYIISYKQRRELETELKLLGGENKYPWGEIKLSEDKKGGSLSIFISYSAV